jgi:hypothetical protein
MTRSGSRGPRVSSLSVTVGIVLSANKAQVASVARGVG